jgi:hypothetical protein
LAVPYQVHGLIVDLRAAGVIADALLQRLYFLP